MGHYELTEYADVYTQLMFSDYESIAQIAPGGNFFDTNTINCDNPNLSAQQLATIGCDAAAIAAGTIVPLYMRVVTSRAVDARTASRTTRSAG
jgi:hypothetical protein